MTSPDVGSPDGQPVLAVAACSGHRCAALRAASADLRELSAAVRGSRAAILVDLPCVGECSQACVVATGRASLADGSIGWLERPRRWDLADRSEQARGILDWLATTSVAGAARP